MTVSHHFIPFGVETSGVLGQTALSLVWDIGQCLRQATGEEHSKEYLLQRIAIAVQRGCSSARDLGEAGGSLLGLTEGAPSPHLLLFLIKLIYNYHIHIILC